jgi:hypothetical protein
VTETKSLTLAPGEKATVADLTGPQAITGLKASLEWSKGFLLLLLVVLVLLTQMMLAPWFLNPISA